MGPAEGAACTLPSDVTRCAPYAAPFKRGAACRSGSLRGRRSRVLTSRRCSRSRALAYSSYFYDADVGNYYYGQGEPPLPQGGRSCRPQRVPVCSWPAATRCPGAANSSFADALLLTRWSGAFPYPVAADRPPHEAAPRANDAQPTAPLRAVSAHGGVSPAPGGPRGYDQVPLVGLCQLPVIGHARNAAREPEDAEALQCRRRLPRVRWAV